MFGGAVLNNADLSYANIWEAEFSGAELVDADFSHAVINEAFFNGSDLSDASLEGTTPVARLDALSVSTPNAGLLAFPSLHAVSSLTLRTWCCGRAPPRH